MAGWCLPVVFTFEDKEGRGAEIGTNRLHSAYSVSYIVGVSLLKNKEMVVGEKNCRPCIGGVMANQRLCNVYNALA